MTLEQLLSSNADTLEKLSETELIATLSPFFNVTRPELVKSNASVSAKPKAPKQLSFEEQDRLLKIERAKEIARKMGIKIS